MADTTSPARASLPVVGAAPGQGLGRSIDYETFMDCVHCGLCLGSCPTYNETGNENDSPRGRIYLWRAVTDGRAELTPEVRKHLDLCLECKACETACPSGVKYGEIIGSYKHDMARIGPALPQVTGLQRWMLFNLTPSASRMAWALYPIRLAERLGLRWLVDGMARILPRSLRQMHEIVPPLAAHHGRLPEILPAEGPRRARVGVFVGCAADAFFPQTTSATIGVLRRNGCEVVIPRSQGCCGALHEHAGLTSEAQRYMAANIAAFGPDFSGLDAIVTNAGGCGPVMKHTGHVMHDTPLAKAAEAFAAKVRDVHEFLAELGAVKPTHAIPVRATYHDACGLSHGQKIRSQPRDLLKLIPGLELVPLAESELCCGAAGSYNITQPEMAHSVGERKARNILATGAKAVFTGNVGCQLQIARELKALGATPWVAHPVDALWAAYTGVMPRELAQAK